MEVNYVRKGVDTVNEAIRADHGGQLDMAFQLYMQALGYFEMELKHGTNANLKEKLKRQMLTYVERAETIKAEAQCSSAHSSSSGGGSSRNDRSSSGAGGRGRSGGGGGGGGGVNRTRGRGQKSGDGGDGDENSRLRDAVSATITTTTDPVRWADIAGLEEAKKSLKEAAIIPIRAPQLLEGVSGSWKGILLYGPPGTGKSHLARAVATEAGATFFSVSASDMMSKWVGESERLVKALFEVAREQKPAIIFVDEIDALLPAREGGGSSSGSGNRVVGEFLAQLDGVGRDQKNVLFLGATNRPWALDPAVLRTGRFEKKIYIPLPDAAARVQLFRIHSKSTLDEAQCLALAERTEGFSGSDVAGVVKSAMLRPLRKVQEATHFRVEDGNAVPCESSDPMGEEMGWEDFDDPRILKKPALCYEDFTTALEHSKASVDPDTLPRYEAWTHKFGIK